MLNQMVQFFRGRWAMVAAVGVVMIVLSLALLSFALAPGPEPARVQATLAPTLFVPPAVK